MKRLKLLKAAVIITVLVPALSCALGFNGDNTEKSSGAQEHDGGVSWKGVHRTVGPGGVSTTASASREVDLDWGQEDELEHEDTRYPYYMISYGVIYTDLNNLFETTTPATRILPKVEGITDYKAAYLANTPLTGAQQTALGTILAGYGDYTDEWRKAKYQAAAATVESYLDQWLAAYSIDHAVFTGATLTVDLGDEYSAGQKEFNRPLTAAALQDSIFGKFAIAGAAPGNIALTITATSATAVYSPHADSTTIDAVYGDNITIPSSGGKVTTYYGGLAAVWLKPISGNDAIDILPLNPNN